MREKFTPEERAAWVAGFITQFGAFTFYNAGRTPVLVLKTLKGVDRLEQFADFVDVEVHIYEAPINSKPGHRVIVSGEAKLKEVMKQVWKYLPNSRKKEFVDMMKLRHSRMEYRKNKKKRSR